MHRVKGLEFDHMLVAGLNEGIVPSSSLLASTENPKYRVYLEDQERCLLFVAATRARKSLLLTCGGRPSPILRCSGFA